MSCAALELPSFLNTLDTAPTHLQSSMGVILKAISISLYIDIYIYMYYTCVDIIDAMKLLMSMGSTQCRGQDNYQHDHGFLNPKP